ncbi:chemotaxis response regulator protein-glutamate methylesterase [Sneathiella sp. HT1-7]|nr:chemotaxis response regulator protein-glutamate methylesterase [Sneathiella sp. HT1-7]MCC3306547.1 chemotaxis response regulator protein-glutamate methylesterase [Sneathiella sp. HT1-7]
MVQADTITSLPIETNKDPYRIMIVDDSAVIRGFLTRWLEAESDIQVVAIANNGVAALREFERTLPELVILDIEMPEMDGLTALPRLVQLDKSVQVIMASTLTRRNADVSLKALAMGAADYIAKPESTRDVNEKEEFHRGLLEKIRALGQTRRLRDRKAGKVAPRPTLKPTLLGETAPAPLHKKSTFNLRPYGKNLAPKVIAIGSSTGGPQALFKTFEALKGKTSLPILITQHMPATFTAILAEHLSKIYGKDCREASDGEKVLENRVYVAPGDWHMTVVRKGTDVVIKLNQEPPENYCRPSVDPMLRSLMTAYGSDVLAVILTGMGHDGLEGCKKLAESGAVVIGQDEETSVVWGMPGAVASADLCNGVFPLEKIPGAIENILKGRPV